MTTRPDFSGVKWVRFGPAVVVAAGVIAYANSFSNTFILDDSSTVLRARFSDSHLWPLRFVVDLSFRLNAVVGGYNVADYHLVNLLVHLVAGLLLYGIVRRTLLLPRFAGGYSGAAPWLAAVTAALWIAHPLQTESVTYICQRYESVMGLFYLLTLYCFIRASDTSPVRFWKILSVTACALGMGAKENMVTAPLLVLLYDYMFLSSGWARVIGDRWRIHVALLGTWGVLAGLAVKRMSVNAAIGVPTLSGISSVDYLLTQCGVITHYLKLSFYPRGLCLDYAWPPAERLADILPPVLLMVVLLVGTIWAVKRRFAAGYLGAWFFIILAPTSSVIPMGDMAFEHRMYLPLAAPVCLAVVSGYLAMEAVLERLDVRKAVRMLGWAGGSALLLALAVWLTICRNAVYHSEIGMWQDVVAKSPGNCRAQLALTTALLKEQRFSEADASGRGLLETVNRLEGVQDGGYRLSRWMSTHYRRAALNALGQALLGQGRFDGAADCFRKAGGIGGGSYSACGLAQALYLLGHYEEALTTCETVLAKEPRSAEAHVLMGCLQERQNKHGEAAGSFKKALALMPDDVTVKCRLAWLLATCPDDTVCDGELALRLAQAVYHHTGGFSIRALDVLAAAYAARGSFDNAVKTQEKAVGMADEARDRGMAMGVPGTQLPEEGLVGGVPVEDMRRRLELYREGKAYRDER